MMKQIPNLLTLANLACGILAIMAVFEGKPVQASWLMLLAAGFDFLDGFAARLLKANSPLGVQLDSLADLVTFGVAPGFIMQYLAVSNGYCSAEGFCINGYIFLAIPLFSAYRLAKFNIDERQTAGFLGVPTPANALLIASFPFIVEAQGLLEPVVTHFRFVTLFPVISAYLLVSELPLMAFKFKSFNLRAQPFHYTFLLLIVAGVAIQGWQAVPWIFLAYLLLSALDAWFTRRSETEPHSNGTT
jgi:CDP-diacylglycerol--serine O-phosphatidyltransferase